MADWRIRSEVEIEKYNKAALEIVNREQVLVDDLHEVIMQNDFTKCLSADGCHMAEHGNEVLSDAVVKLFRALT